MMFDSPMWITPLSPCAHCVGEGSHGSNRSGNYPSDRVSSACKSTATPSIETPERGAAAVGLKLSDGRMADPIRQFASDIFDLGDLTANFGDTVGSRRMFDYGRGVRNAIERRHFAAQADAAESTNAARAEIKAAATAGSSPFTTSAILARPTLRECNNPSASIPCRWNDCSPNRSRENPS
jgi:hypothetical protein